MTVHFIGAGPGAPDLITLRGRNLLARCPVCLFAGSTISRDILAHCDPGTETIDTAPMTLDEIEAVMLSAHCEGKDVARLHSGDLSCYSAIAEQTRRLERKGIPFTLTPGVPSFAAASAALGREFTVPGLVQSVVLTRISGRASEVPQSESLAAYATTGATLVIHLAVHDIRKIVDMVSPVLGKSCPVAVVERASWADERIVHGTLADIESKLAAAPIERMALIVIGQALSSRTFQESALYDPNYRRRFREGKSD